MALRLRDNLHWCACAGRLVFLDLQADRYFCLPPKPEAALLRLISGTADAADRHHLGALIAKGLILSDPDSTGPSPACAIDPVVGDFLDEPFPASGPLEVARALAAEARAAWRLRRNGLHRIIESVEPRGPIVAPSQLSDHSHRDLARIAAAFKSSSLFARATDRCLVRAIAAHSQCRRISTGAKLVFGVRMHPFGAHCWVEFERRVIVGDYEQARLYTPILVAG